MLKGSRTPVKLLTTPPVVMRPIESPPRIGEPERAVRPGRDAQRALDAGVGEIGDGAVRGDAADRAVSSIGEPEGAVRPGRDALRIRNGRVGEVGDGSVRRHAADEIPVGEPQVVIGPLRNGTRDNDGPIAPVITGHGPGGCVRSRLRRGQRADDGTAHQQRQQCPCDQRRAHAAPLRIRHFGLHDPTPIRCSRANRIPRHHCNPSEPQRIAGDANEHSGFSVGPKVTNSP